MDFLAHRRCKRRGQRHAEDGPLAGAAFALDRAAVGRDDFADDRQPQAAAARGRIARNAKVPLENQRQIFGRNAGAGIRHRENHVAGRSFRRQRDPPAARACGPGRFPAGSAGRAATGPCRPAPAGQGPGLPARTPRPGPAARGWKASNAARNKVAGDSGCRRSWLPPCSKRARSKRLLIMANSRSALSRASTRSSSCLGSSGPTSSCRSRCSTRRMLVSGVFSSWLTVATMLLFTSSRRRNRVTSSSSTAAPNVADAASRIGRTRGR